MPSTDPTRPARPDGGAPGEQEAAIRAEIVTRARLDPSHVQVAVTGSTVVITGSVTSAAAKHQAGRVARDTPGVEVVENRLVTVVR